LALPEGRQWELGRGARSAKGGCRGSFDLVLLVTHLGEVYCVCTTRETYRAAMHQGSLSKGYVVCPWTFTSVVKIGSVQPKLERDHDSLVKCATSAEC
jgi:hypothetical protein